MSSLIGTSADWYLMRASGFVALALLTVSVALGVANVARVARRPGSRAVAALVHRNTALLAVVFLAVHVLTAISDPYVKISLLSTVVPGLSGYDPLWIGVGALSVDLMAAVIVTSLLRHRLGDRTWRAVHWLSYAAWPTALVHGLGSGSGKGADTGTAWSTVAYLILALTFAGAVAYRRWHHQQPAPTDPPTLSPRPHYPAPAGSTAGTATSRRHP